MKEKILLINPPYANKEIVYFPTGLGYVAGACAREGIDTRFIDMNLGDNQLTRVLDLIKKERFDVIGIGGFAMQLKSTVELANAIKEHCKDATIVIGGVQVFGCDEFLIKNSKADIICSGESEILLPQIVHSLYGTADLSKFESIIYRRNGEIVYNGGFAIIEDIDSLSVPKYDLFDMESYVKGNYHNVPGRRTIDFICSRGCPYKCNYCINSNKPFKMRYRHPDNILAEIRLLKDTYNINDFYFGDEIFTANKKKALEICEILKAENVTWITSGRADGMDDELISAMKKSGCRMLLVGFESASEKILQEMKKRTTKEVYLRAIGLMRKYNLMFYPNFMIGMPSETEETIRETEQFCKDNNLVFGATYVTPFPGTKLYDEIKYKIKDEKAYLYSLANLNFTKEPLINLTGMPVRELMCLRDRAVINTTAHLVQQRFRYVPIFFVRMACRMYLAIFDIKNPVISRILRPITKAIQRLIS